MTDVLGAVREYMRLRRSIAAAQEQAEPDTVFIQQQELYLKAIVALLREKMIDLFRRGSGRRFPSWSGAVAEAESNMSRRQKEIAMNTFYHGTVPIAVFEPGAPNKQGLQSCNMAFQNLFELSWDPEVASGKEIQGDELPPHMLKFAELIHPDHVEGIFQSYETLFREGFRGDRVVTCKCTFVTLQSKRHIDGFFVTHYFQDKSGMVQLTLVFPENRNVLFSSEGSGAPSSSSTTTTASSLVVSATSSSSSSSSSSSTTTPPPDRHTIRQQQQQQHSCR